MRELLSRLLRRRHVPVLKCAICRKEITSTQTAALIHGVESWDRATVHRSCLPAWRRPAVMRLMRLT